MLRIDFVRPPNRIFSSGSLRSLVENPSLSRPEIAIFLRLAVRRADQEGYPRLPGLMGTLSRYLAAEMVHRQLVVAPDADADALRAHPALARWRVVHWQGLPKPWGAPQQFDQGRTQERAPRAMGAARAAI